MKQLSTLFALLLLMINPAYALTDQQLTTLRETVHEMCLLPDRSGDYLKAEGEAKAGTAVPIRLVKGDISGKISYETWKGIPITLDKYKTDPRQCALEMMRLLLPTFAPNNTPRPATKKKARVTDILIEKTDHQSAIVDFRVLNESGVDLQISRVKLVPLKHSRKCSKGPADYSKVYAFHDIDGLSQFSEAPLEIPVSQVISAGKADRFGIEVGPTDPRCSQDYWKFKAYLVTSAGEIGGQQLELRLRELPGASEL